MVIPESTFLEVKRLLDEGHSQREVAIRLDVSRAFIHNVASGRRTLVLKKTAGGPRRGVNYRLTNDDLAVICYLRKDGESLSEIGRRFGVSRQTVLNVVKGLVKPSRERGEFFEETT